MYVIASILKNNGLYAGAARRGEKLIATTLPVNDLETAKKNLVNEIPDKNIEFKDDAFCLSVSEKIFQAVRGEQVEFSETVDLSSLPPFQRKVLEATKEIGWGHVTTYGKLADKLGNKKAARAVGNALAANPLPMIIGCHRIVKSDGRIGGFGYGPEVKKKLLQNEGIKLERDRITLAS
jgi:methylated-DNA-[protein]-cysteine S-methyltransferase